MSFKVVNTNEASKIPYVVLFPPQNIEITNGNEGDRRLMSLCVRNNANISEYNTNYPVSISNGDEEKYPSKIGNYSKGLPHNSLGEVNIDAWNSLIYALTTGKPSDFDKIIIGGPVKQVNPQSGLAYDLEGQDSHTSYMPPAPQFSSDENAGEILEDYWMALCRDITFNNYQTESLNPSSLISRAITDLNTQTLEAPKVGGVITVDTLFRGYDPTGGIFIGPYISQFMYWDVTVGAVTYPQKSSTYLPGSDYLVDYTEWLNIQDGKNPTHSPAIDPTPRYIRNGRDLAQWVHVDHLFQAYFQALSILIGKNAPVSPTNPYKGNITQSGFTTFGNPFICGLMSEVANRVLKCAWYQKWYVHLRLRPEAMGGCIHNNLTGATTYPISSRLNTGNDALQQTFSNNGTYLLSQTYPEGCPTHPSYPAGHQSVGAACVTILKAFFDESTPITSLGTVVVPSDDGLSLVPYTGSTDGMTVGSELNKICANVGLGRDFAGVHWRSDDTFALFLGEELAISILRDQINTFNEDFAGWTFTRFNGEKITISK